MFSNAICLSGELTVVLTWPWFRNETVCVLDEDVTTTRTRYKCVRAYTRLSFTRCTRGAWEIGSSKDSNCFQTLSNILSIFIFDKSIVKFPLFFNIHSKLNY